MRTACIEEISRLAAADSNVMLLTGDLGFSVFEAFAAAYPEQYLNVGVAEQNLMGVAAGLALGGKRVYVYSITPFASMRGFEQVRNDIAYQNVPVTIIGGGSTFSYSRYGCTHFALEDLSIMRTLPNMAVTCAGDPAEVRALVHAAYKRQGPTYVRIAKRGEPTVHAASDAITLGILSVLQPKGDVALIASGRVLANVVAAAKQLQQQGIPVRIASCHTLKPLDEQGVCDLLSGCQHVFTFEDHSIIGGLGSAVAEVIARNRLSIPLTVRGIPDEFPAGVQSEESFSHQYGLGVEEIVQAIREVS